MIAVVGSKSRENVMAGWLAESFGFLRGPKNETLCFGRADTFRMRHRALKRSPLFLSIHRCGKKSVKMVG